MNADPSPTARRVLSYLYPEVTLRLSREEATRLAEFLASHCLTGDPLLAAISLELFDLGIEL